MLSRRRTAKTLAWLALASAALGCRAHGDLQPPVPEPESDTDASEDGPPPPTAVGPPRLPPAPDGGPKLMGYEYFLRMSYGPETTTYSDTENNAVARRKSSTSGVSMTGHRYMLEHYPVVREAYPHSDYGYAAIDYRDDTPNRDYWTKHQTLVLLMGYVLPVHRIITPVLGLHMEFNKIDVNKDDTPEVTKSDIRALVAGVDVRQKIFGTGDWFGAFYGLKLHILNPLQKSTGAEAEASLGTTFQIFFLRTDLTANYNYQRYDGEEPSPDGLGSLSLRSTMQTTNVMVTLWF